MLANLNSASGAIHFHSGYLEMLMGAWDTLDHIFLDQPPDHAFGPEPSLITD
jgi:hypothetical protein